MATAPKLQLRDFRSVEEDFEYVLSKLRRTVNPKDRVNLLRKLRELLDEADLIIEPQ